MPCSAALRGLALAAAVTGAASVLSAAEVHRGIAYGPVPLKGAGHIPLDDFMAGEAKPLWGRRGRGDLAIMRQLGANVVRLYGNDPAQDHRGFLDEALATGLDVVVGISDYPYTQSSDNCQRTGYDCYDQIKASYLQNLQRGFLLQDGTYHPALEHVIIINEPDLKLPGIAEPRQFAKGLISAIDAIVDAEREAGVKGRVANLTATFSFGMCFECVQHAAWGCKPALNQMMELRAAMLDPRSYGYQPRNDLAEVYRSRVINSYNTANPSQDIRPMFLDAYEVEFPSTPVIIEEFHAAMFPDLDLAEDVSNALRISEASPLLLGVSFFEFQVRYDKGGTEMSFGMFGLGDFEITDLYFFTARYPVWCLAPVVKWSAVVSAGVATAYGGADVDFPELCRPDPRKVPLTEAGFAQIFAQNNASRLAVYVGRAVENMGGKVSDHYALMSAVDEVSDYQGLVGMLEGHPAWAVWDPFAACVADRQSDSAAVGKAIEDACLHTWFNCSYVPSECAADPWTTADYVFSVYYNQEGGSPLSACYAGGAAALLRSEAYSGLDSRCVVTLNPATTPLTDEGFQAILNQNDPGRMAAFMSRVVAERFGGARVSDRGQLQQFAASPPASMYDLTSLLRAAQWVCGGGTGRACPGTGGAWDGGASGQLWWWKWGFALIGFVVLVALLATVAYVVLRPRCLAKAKLRESRGEAKAGSLPSAPEDAADRA